MKQKNQPKDALKAFHKANRELQFERNGGGQFVCVNRKWKDKTKYDRKQNKRELSRHLDSSLSFLIFLPIVNT